jgi:nucleoside-diphosphate-sugar epimerase
LPRILLTGASGFIGRNCLHSLINKGYEVHAIARHSLANVPGVIWHQVDLLEPGCAAELARNVCGTHLLHFAWCTTHGLYWTAAENESWVGATVELVEAFARSGGRRAVCAGTCAEYAWDGGICDELSTPLRPATSYGQTKVSLYRRLEEMAERLGFSFAWGRVFFPYGPCEPAPRLVPSVITALLRRMPVQCTAGDQVRDFLHVEDVADAFVALLESRSQSGTNIASGVPVSVRELVTSLGLMLGGLELVQFGALPPREGDPPFLVADTRRLHDEIGWWPRWALPDGLAQTIEWWRRAEVHRCSTIGPAP